MKKDIAIKLSHVSKEYLLHSQRPTLIENLSPFKKKLQYWALSNINLLIKQGERVVITGANGSGKTTLLEIMAHITQPTTGTVNTYGRIVSLIELTAGFHLEMNGIDNIYLNGLLLGMSKKEIDQKIKQIIDYSGVGNFIYQPIYTYSNGMTLRLSIAILFHVDADIYLFDENLFVGDKSFRDQVYKTLNDFSFKNKTLVFVAPNLNRFIKWFCRRVIYLDKGKIKTQKREALTK